MIMQMYCTPSITIMKAFCKNEESCIVPASVYKGNYVV